MAKKHAKKRSIKAEKPNKATFEVRFKGPGVSPDTVSLRSVNDALSAVQDLASGRDPFETSQVPASKMVGLVDVRRGSAVYSCVARSPVEAKANLARVSDILSDDPDAEIDDRAVAAFRPIESLSEVARSIGCRLEVALVGASRQPPLFTIGHSDYERLAARLFIEGDTTITGSVQRVGGATDMRCVLRVPGRRKLLYCNVGDKATAQKLGQHLYEEVAAVGKAIWLNKAWRIHHFTIRDFSQPRLGDVNKAIEELRKAGLDAWDDIRDPKAYANRL